MGIELQAWNVVPVEVSPSGASSDAQRVAFADSAGVVNGARREGGGLCPLFQRGEPSQLRSPALRTPLHRNRPTRETGTHARLVGPPLSAVDDMIDDILAKRRGRTSFDLALPPLLQLG